MDMIDAKNALYSESNENGKSVVESDIVMLWRNELNQSILYKYTN